MSIAKIKELLDKSDGYDSTPYYRYSWGSEERNLLAGLVRGLLKIVMSEIENFKENGYIKDETLFLSGTNNKQILKTKSSGEVIIIKIKSSNERSWNYRDKVINEFFGKKIEEFKNATWNKKSNMIDSYELTQIDTLDPRSWGSLEMVNFLVFVKNHLESKNINDFFATIEEKANEIKQRKDHNKTRTDKKRALEFATVTQKWMARDILLAYLLKDKQIAFNDSDQIIDQVNIPNYYTPKIELTNFLKFSFEEKSPANYLVWLVYGTTDLDRSGEKLVEAALELLGEEWFTKLRFVANPDFRRLYFLHGPSSDLVLGAMDCDQKVRMAAELMIKNKLKEAL